MRLTTVITAFLTLASTAAYAQQPEVTVLLGSSSIEVGEVVNMQIVCTNTGEPSAPSGEVPAGLDVRLTNATPAMFQQQSIINGRRSSQTTYTFHLRLSASRPGDYTVGPFSVTGDGATHQSNAVRVSVRAPTEETGPRGDRLVFVELTASPEQLYVTESYTATLTIGIRTVVIDGRDYNMDLLQQVLDLSASEISIFAGGQANRSEQWLRDSSGQRHRYEIFRVTRQVRAEQSGPLTVGPIFLKAKYPTAVRRGFFGRTEISRHRKESARAAPISINVLDPPLATRPADFTGAIGRYTMEVTVKPEHVELGQPVTLTVAIRGRPIDGVAGPDLAAHAELTSRFDFTPDELVGDVEGGVKLFRRAIFPRQAGEQTIPAITWSYFDTAREQYQTLTSDPIDIVVDAPANPTGELTLFNKLDRTSDATSLTLVSGGIMPNYVDPDVVLANHTLPVRGAWTLAVLVLPPVLCLGVTLGAKRRERMRSDIGFSRASKAAAGANRAIRQALALGSPPDQLAGLAHALGAYVSDRFNVGHGQLTPVECREILRRHGFDDATTDPMIDFLERCDALRYAPGTAPTMAPQEAADNLRRWLRVLERGAS